MYNYALPAERKLFLLDPAEQARSLTPDLLNKGQFLDRLGRELVRTKSCISGRFVVMCIDLDRFKVVTSSLGRRAGNDLLSAIAVRLQSLLGTRDAMARIEDDEFAILFEEPSRFGSPVQFAARIQKELIAGFNLSGTVVYTTASIGITRLASSYSSAGEILRDAEVAMYSAKARGRARTELFYPDMNFPLGIDPHELEDELYLAVERREFELFYQPILSVANGRVQGFEALLRWRNPVRGLLEPSSFMDMLNETGLIVPVGEWTISEACRQARVWQGIRLHHIPVTINLAPQQLRDENIVNTVLDAIEESGVNPRGVILELTEDGILEDLDSASDKLATLRERGVRVMIDDFGTGYSSLSYIRRLPVDAIKLDASFVERIEQFAEDRMIVRAIIAIAHALDLRVVAEGVERPAQLAELMNLECEEVQGYMFSAPIDACAATQMIESRWTGEFAV